MHKNVISDSVKTLKKCPEIFLYSFLYTLIIMTFSLVENYSFYKTIVWGEWRILCTNNMILYFTISFIIHSIEEVILTSFVYMILNNKMKIKRFFYFMNKENVRYNVLFSLLIILPIEIFRLELNLGAFKRSVYFSVPIVMAFFIVKIFSHFMISFKVENKSAGFKIIFSKAFKFVSDNFSTLSVLYLKAFIPTQIVLMLLEKIMYEIIAEDVIFCAFKSVHFGVDIFFIPLYFFCLHNLKNERTI